MPDKASPSDIRATNTNDSGAIGRQITLPLSKAFEIAWRGIRVRLWRSIITMSGVILAWNGAGTMTSSSVTCAAIHDLPSSPRKWPRPAKRFMGDGGSPALGKTGDDTGQLR